MITKLHLSFQIISTLVAGVWLLAMGTWPLDDSYAADLNDYGWKMASIKNAVETLVAGALFWALFLVPMWLSFRSELSDKPSRLMLLWPLIVILVIAVINGLRFYSVRPYI